MAKVRVGDLVGSLAVAFVVAALLVGCGNDGAETPAESGRDELAQPDPPSSEPESAESESAEPESAESESAESESEGSESEESAEPSDDGDGEVVELYPDVVDASANRAADGSWTFSATLSSPYDSPARYADAWRVVGPDGEVYGIRELAHDHANEQPFTRSQSGIVIPDGIAVVVVEGRDQVSGWGGATFEVPLDEAG